MMKNIRSIITSLVIAAAFAISLIGASAAFAQGPLSDLGLVVFHGSATLSGTIPGGVPPQTGGGGTFRFEGDADASLIYSDPVEGLEPGDPIGFAGHIHATGTYQNVVCGTGSVSGDATVASDDDNFYVSFTIDYVAGVGVLVVNNAASDDGDTGGVGAGIVLLSNINNAGQPDECTGDTTGFQVEAAVTHTVFEGGD
jgi:hypothetical protein